MDQEKMQALIKNLMQINEELKKMVKEANARLDNINSHVNRLSKKPAHKTFNAFTRTALLCAVHQSQN